MDLSSVPSLEQLKKSFQKLPGIGPKSAFRMALYILKAPEEQVQHLLSSVQSARSLLSFCTKCNAFVEGEGECRFCLDDHRSNDVICVVEDPMVPLTLEAKQKAAWKYHVTHGLVSPIDETYPEDLKLGNLWNRLSEIQELILTFSSSVEGEATAAYMMEEVKRRAPHIKISKIAHGIPFGARLDGVDQMTLLHALKDRQLVT